MNACGDTSTRLNRFAVRRLFERQITTPYEIRDPWSESVRPLFTCPAGTKTCCRVPTRKIDGPGPEQPVPRRGKRHRAGLLSGCIKSGRAVICKQVTPGTSLG